MVTPAVVVALSPEEVESKYTRIVFAPSARLAFGIVIESARAGEAQDSERAPTPPSHLRYPASMTGLGLTRGS